MFAEIADKLKKEAYAAGWRDALAAITKMASEAAPPEVISLVGPTQPPKPVVGGGNGGGAGKPLTQGTTPFYVVEALKMKPGMTAGQIIDTLRDQGHTAPDNSIRTNIHRLKERRLIVLRHGKWFVA
ncbi:hypothetical protein J2W51_002840 [Tardiphaga robiniae]|uniref:hypothetical protein n=1 Tax=Tardiphaga robiniae TaxID=943830 RepID=UPI00286315E5|nr:hypothetical protein [Tardiphaga robiniae]MDR6660270.1 hypothetical protein [Tardiphaga robiniae]